MFGWHGRILHIDLSNKSSRFQTITHDSLHSAIGGRGLAVSLFEDFTNLDPFDPDIPLIMTTGPLSGTETPASERLCILSRSPLTGTIFDSLAGGSFARALKASGHDGLYVTGRSDRPLGLRINSEGVEFIPLDKLWGFSTSRTIANFKEQGVAAIGPAGEKQVLYANIVFNDGEIAGRGGLGAIMGSKQIKVIAIDGDLETTVADPSRLKQANQDIMRLLRASPAVFGQFGLHQYGTPAFVDLINQRSMLPTHNFTETYFRHAKRCSGTTIRKELNPQHDRCYDCPIACKKNDINRNRLPEYSALCHFGPLLGNSNLHAILAANATCKELGLDPVSAASTLATHSEISGRIPAPDALPDILYQVCNDSLLALGSRRLADHFDRTETAMTVKSLELPAFDPRGATGMALSFCTSTLGGTQTRANLQACEILRKPVAVDRFSYTGKARLLKIAEDAHAVYDSLVVCHNAFYAASLEEYNEALCAVTGVEFTPADLFRSGESVILREQQINRNYGFTTEDDMLPERFFTNSGTEANGIVIPPLDKQSFKDELQRYYRIRGSINHKPGLQPSTQEGV